MFQLFSILFCFAAFGFAAASSRPWNLNDYKLCKFYKLPAINDNASGAAYIPSTKHVWIVQNKPERLYEYSMDGRKIREMGLGKLKDTEGVTWLHKGQMLAVVEENPGGNISIIDPSLESKHTVTKRIYTGDIPRYGGAGLESITYDPRNGSFFVAVEHNPKKIYKVYEDGKHKELLDGDKLGWPIGDIADLYYDTAVPDDLFVLSQESSRLLRVRLSDGQVLQQRQVKGSRPEGLTFTPDGMTMIVVAEPNEMAIYQIDNCNV